MHLYLIVCCLLAENESKYFSLFPVFQLHPLFFPSSPLQQVDDRLTDDVSFVSCPELTGNNILIVAIPVSK